MRMIRVTTDELEVIVPDRVQITFDQATGAASASFSGSTYVTPPTKTDDLLSIAHQRIRYRADNVPAAHQEAWVRVLGQCDLVGKCWVYKGRRSTGGYGMCRYRGVMRNAHRVLFQDLFGSLTRDQYVCHSCDNPPCCNPAHLWVGTSSDNAKDRESKGRGAANLVPGMGAEVMLKRTSCGRGHTYTDKTVYVRPKTRTRECLVCTAMRQNAAVTIGGTDYVAKVEQS